MEPREALRRWHMDIVVRVTRLVEQELRLRLETDVHLRHDGYPLDAVNRTTVVRKLTHAGETLPVALAAVGHGGED